MGLSVNEIAYATRLRSEKLYQLNYAKHYRSLDDAEIKTAHSRLMRNRLEALVNAAGPRPLVVDFACGTGRYFNAVRKARLLIAIDASNPMLEMAKRPVLEEHGLPAKIELRLGSFDRLDQIDEGSIDFTHAIGVFGNHCPLNVAQINQFYRILRPGGVFFFTVADAANRIANRKTFKRKVAEAAYSFLPWKWKVKLDLRWIDISLDENQIAELLAKSLFNGGVIEAEMILPESWDGRHFWMTATKL